MSSAMEAARCVVCRDGRAELLLESCPRPAHEVRLAVEAKWLDLRASSFSASAEKMV